MNCQWHTLTKGSKCVGCGRVLPRDYEREPVASCGEPQNLPPREGLGDQTERLLESMGITQDRYVAAKELFGFAPLCDCPKRKAWLNTVSDWWRWQG